MEYFFYNNEIDKIIVEEGKINRKIKARGGGLMLVEVLCENNAMGIPHKHPHEQACYCLEGEFEFIIGDEVKIVKAGDTLYIPSNLSHGFKLLSEKGRILDVFTPQRMDFLDN